MSLIIPTVGQEPGPDYASDINASLSIIDQHTHAAGSGVPITPAALNINTNLTINSHFLTDVAGLVLVAQSSTPAINTVYQSGVDLYFVDGNGNNVRITQSGGIAGSPGTIANLTSPASASYVSGSATFVWQSNTNIAANMDAGSIILRNLSPNSTYGLTLAPPDALSLNYTLTLPSLPVATKFLTLDAAGAIAGGPNLSGGLTTTNLSASAGILGSQLSATAGITGGQISSSAALSIASLACSTTLSVTGLASVGGLVSGGGVSAVSLASSGAATVGTVLTIAGKDAVVSNTNLAAPLAIVQGTIAGTTIPAGGGFTVSSNNGTTLVVAFTTAFSQLYPTIMINGIGAPNAIEGSLTSISASGFTYVATAGSTTDCQIFVCGAKA